MIALAATLAKAGRSGQGGKVGKEFGFLIYLLLSDSLGQTELYKNTIWLTLAFLNDISLGSASNLQRTHNKNTLKLGIPFYSQILK